MAIKSKRSWRNFKLQAQIHANVSLMMNNSEGIILSYLNGPYGYHHYVFDEEGVVIPTPTFFDLPGPVQSISQWSNKDVLILEGQENICIYGTQIVEIIGSRLG